MHGLTSKRYSDCIFIGWVYCKIMVLYPVLDNVYIQYLLRLMCQYETNLLDNMLQIRVS